MQPDACSLKTGNSLNQLFIIKNNEPPAGRFFRTFREDTIYKSPGRKKKDKKNAGKQGHINDFFASIHFSDFIKSTA